MTPFLTPGEKILFLVATLLLTAAVTLSAGCATHRESSSSAQSTLTGTIDSTQKQDVTEPVAVPERLEFRGWMPDPLVPSAGGGTLVNLPQMVMPLRALPKLPTPGLVPDDGVDGRVAGGSYFEGTLYFGTGEKKTHTESGSKGTTTAAIAKKSQSEGDSKPFGIFAFLVAFWPYLAAAVPVLLFLFRKQLLDLAVRVGLKAAP